MTCWDERVPALVFCGVLGWDAHVPESGVLWWIGLGCDSHVPESGVLWCVGLIHMCLRVVFCGGWVGL